MKRSALASFVVAGAFVAGVFGTANLSAAAAQSARVEVRTYDRDHRDYHRWNRAEDRAYRAWLDTRHFTYRQFSRLRNSERRAYWRWRHEHRD
jgi:hypothetical protein